MMDIMNFTRRKNGMSEEYEKIKKSELYLIYANGNTKDALKERFIELSRRKERYEETIERESLELILIYRALKEITENWEEITKE